MAEDLIEAVHVRDLPGMADVDSSLLWFCREIKKDFVVSLCGECADEIFGGYPWFHRLDDLNRSGFPWMRSIDERQGLLKDHWQERLNLKEYSLRNISKWFLKHRYWMGKVSRMHKGENCFILI